MDLIGPTAAPYILISTGPHEVFTTKTVKKSKSPQWNEFFELLVKKNLKKTMEVTVMARDIKNGRDDFIGMAQLHFENFGSEAKDVWVRVQRTNKKRESVVTGEVHLQVRYVRPLATEQKTETQLDNNP